MRLLKTIFLIFFCYLITSCSFIKTGYNNAPKLSIWWLNDYFNLSQTQILKLESALNDLHFWHRQQQLPEIIALLDTMQAAFISDNISADAVCEQVQAFKSKVYALQTKSIPIILAIAPTLTDQQLARFLMKLDKRTQKWKSQWWQESEKEQLSVIVDKAEDFAEKVYGDISEDQLMILKQSLTEANIKPAISYDEILRRNNDAIAILNALRNINKGANQINDVVNEPAVDQVSEIQTKLVQAGFDRMQKSPNSAYQQYVTKLAKNSCETIAKLHTSTNAKQKQHAKKWIGDYIVQLSALQTK